ncbi:cupin domain-containing protein [Kitasatospora sp. NPDC001603]|uniref:cupin domain-containing protein n=1 Tax=Kitasatospora sp. NPDC001603 TaxID=3154388 RepID=UPI003317A1BE
MFRFDRAEKVVDRYDSLGATATPVAAGGETVNLTCLVIEPGGTIGAHPAPVGQLFLVIAGDGWVAGADGQRVPVSAGDGVRWEPGEEHASGTATGLTALAVEGPSLLLLATPGPRAAS